MEDKKITEQEIAHEERRKFLKKAGAVAAAAPVAALLLAASAKPNQALAVSGEATFE